MCVCVLQASNTVEVNIETAERLQVSRVDFMASLNNDIKPVSCCKTVSSIRLLVFSLKKSNRDCTVTAV